jgi:hypothetical protein
LPKDIKTNIVCSCRNVYAEYMAKKASVKIFVFKWKHVY